MSGGRWERFQDRREDRATERLGDARQASWKGIVGLVLALVVVVALIIFAFSYVKNDAVEHDRRNEPSPCTAPPPGPPCRQVP
ncbi:hypothetical protein KSP35_23225 [Aquihabitans sp. G128]|uniref:hypothetical protein n=1 Tax=Aquihabitans sp. G128 TaxID=2849779 RepID=UPI001C213A7D|nr:hypothetical protein [Aquihabitans sp. G128]QXC61186.1 hypothetical protein KSP35_23225 [Aquihabitans sp. G128]